MGGVENDLADKEANAVSSYSNNHNDDSCYYDALSVPMDTANDVLPITKPCPALTCFSPAALKAESVGTPLQKP